MKQTRLQWTLLAFLLAVALGLGALIGTAQTETGAKPPEDSVQKLEQIAQKLDDLSKKLDEVTKKLDAIQADVYFIKARGKG